MARVWSAVGGDPAARGRLDLSGPRRVLPSVFDVTGLATGAAASVALGLGEVVAARTGADAPRAAVDTRRSCAAFVAERLFRPVGWELPGLWDPLSGDHRARDGWVRLHMNYPWHRAAGLAALGLADGSGRDEVAAVVAGADAADVETAVVDAGGCAAALMSAEQWYLHPHGRVARAEPAVSSRSAPTGGAPGHRPWMSTGEPPESALAGVRILDLTRVIAGPVCTRLLAAHGATVVRVDPPAFPEVGALLPETTLGKRCAALDLREDDDRRRLEELVEQADVVVHGLRPGALEGLGVDPASWTEQFPGLVVARLDAYGWTGPWAGRRGFDSLVQMSTGLAHAGMVAAAAAEPVPLPAQALDHGAGHLMAAAVLRALAARARGEAGAEIHVSLVGVAHLLRSMPDDDGSAVPPAVWGTADVEDRMTAWGPAQGVPAPRDVTGWPGRWIVAAGPLGRDAASFDL